MLVGIVNMYKEKELTQSTQSNDIFYLVKAILDLGHTPLLLHFTDPCLHKNIEESSIQHWIFSGSTHTVHNRSAPQIQLKSLTSMWNKKFFLICYSMESALLQLGHAVKKRSSGVKREYFSLYGKRFWRFHSYYIPSFTHSQAREIVSIVSHDGESMIAIYKNILMTQFHPEKTSDGRTLLYHWLS